MRNWKRKRKRNKITSSGRSTFGSPFSNKISTICSYPFSAATQRGVLSSFWFKKIEKWVSEKKKKNKQSTKEH